MDTCPPAADICSQVGVICPRAADICPRVADNRGHLSASGRHCLPTDPLISYSGGQKIWRTCPRYFWRTTVRHRRIFVRGGQLSASCPPTFLKFLQTKLVHHGILADFLADCPRVDGGPDRIRSDPPRTLADFLCPHKVRLSPPESAKKRSSADTGADSGGQWRTQADPIGSAADSGGQLSANIKPQFPEIRI